MEFSDEQGRGYAVAPCPRADLARPALCSRSRLIIEWQRRKRTFKRGLACCSAIGAPDEIRTPRFGNRLGNVGVSGPSMTNSQPRARLTFSCFESYQAASASL